MQIVAISCIVITNSMKLIREKQIQLRDFNLYFVCSGLRGKEYK